ncbi:MAG: glycosyltransferase family 39 protein [Pirellulaceae bacterium]|nr:glycosyltransferase family 39 protein [Pirellulaceae bacterium]
MKSSQVLVVACLLILTAAALAIRLPRLDQRPMHGDEANQAVKAGVLLEAGQYQYDPQEHHGPSLYWLTLPSLWLHGRETFAQTTETDYRIVPVVFGVGLIVLLWFLADGLGRGPAVLAGLFTAISPALVFYSRYYIQETLLVFFTLAALAAGWRYARDRTITWAVLCGTAVGMMHATKETWVLAAAAAGWGGLADPAHGLAAVGAAWLSGGRLLQLGVVFVFRPQPARPPGFDPGLRRVRPPRQRNRNPLASVVLLPRVAPGLPARSRFLLVGRTDRRPGGRGYARQPPP